MNWLTPRSIELPADLRRQDIHRILLVRSLFRMGDSILATPAILLLRENFPGAVIDFVGPPISKPLIENLPIDHQYVVHRGFPKVCWSYVLLLRRIRQANYDLAVNVSCSSAALGSFIVGFSAARFRSGVRGKWDRWFNLRLAKPAMNNKYGSLPELIGSMGLESRRVFPTVALSPAAIAQGRLKLHALVGSEETRVVGIFVGGRKSRGKRWAKENFLDLTVRLREAGLKPVVFVGPEEKKLLIYFRDRLGSGSPVIFEPDVKHFAALVANCRLFIACDSGPVHLACALRVRTVAVFLQNNFDHWGPPPNLGRIVFHKDGVSVDAVVEACRQELVKTALNQDRLQPCDRLGLQRASSVAVAHSFEGALLPPGPSA